MKRFTLFQWATVMTLALAPPAASAQEEDSVTISGVFRMDYAYGEDDLYYVAPELLAVYANGQEHTWTLTLHGTTQSHYSQEIDYVELVQDTEIHATSFALEFFGPDAATLNSMVSDHLAGANVWIFLRNHYMYYSDDDFAVMEVAVYGPEMFFRTETIYSSTLFMTDAEGYPVVGPEPFSIESNSTEVGFFELFSGIGGAIGSLAGPVTFEGSVGQSPPPPPTLAIQDGSVLEGNRGTTNLNLTVTLSASSTGTVIVNYTTYNGTAKAGSDYNSAVGTLTFQPGQTSKTISISVKGDRKREPNETCYVDLLEPDGATIADGTATATIINDD